MKIYHFLFALLLTAGPVIPMAQPVARKRFVPQQTLSTLGKYKTAPCPQVLKSILSLADNLHDCMKEAEGCIQIQEVILTHNQQKLLTDTYAALVTIKNLAEQNPANRFSLETAITAIPSFAFTYLAYNAFDFPEVEEDCPDNDIVQVTTYKYVQKMLTILRENT